MSKNVITKRERKWKQYKVWSPKMEDPAKWIDLLYKIFRKGSIYKITEDRFYKKTKSDIYRRGFRRGWGLALVWTLRLIRQMGYKMPIEEPYVIRRYLRNVLFEMLPYTPTTSQDVKVSLSSLFED